MQTERGAGAAEAEFAADELFFSVTDEASAITAGNAVFRRVSGYAEADLLGAPHNLVRHADMPRCVFRILWDRIRAGLPVAAYVKNRARDGSFYWVVATVVPVADGYLSVRQKPCGPHHAAAEAAYAVLRALEAELEEAGTPREQVIAASLARLDELLAGLGFDGYDAFMRAMLPAELAARPDSRRLAVASADAIGEIATATDRLRTTFGDVFENLDRYAALGADLTGRAGRVTALADDVRLFALNTVIASVRLGEAGPPLGVIADTMRREADATTALARQLRDEVDTALALLPDIAFDAAIAKLQADMAGFFVHEAATAAPSHDAAAGERAAADVRDAIVLLADAVATRAGHLGGGLHRLDQGLATIAGQARRLDGTLRALDALQISGRVEIARNRDAQAFSTLFETVRATIADAAETSRGLHTAATRGADAGTTSLVHDTSADLERIREAAPRIRPSVVALPPEHEADDEALADHDEVTIDPADKAGDELDPAPPTQPAPRRRAPLLARLVRRLRRSQRGGSASPTATAG